MADLIFRKDDFADSARRQPLLDLLRDVFAIDLAELSTRDIWHPGYRAFSYWSGKTLAANVSIRPLPLMVGGKTVRAAQLHAVATRPQWRRRGLFADLMNRVLDYAEGRFDRLLLFTAEPALYQPFGFRLLPQHVFAGSFATDGTDAGPHPCRQLSLDDPDDCTLMRALYMTRRPVSQHFAVVENGDVFFANALARPHWRLLYLPRAEALIVCDGGRLLDIAAATMPPVSALAAALECGRDAEIEVYFPPDALAGTWRALPFSPPEDDHLMLRGPLEIESRPIILPPTTLS